MPQMLHLRFLHPPHGLTEENCEPSTWLLLETRWLADEPHNSGDVIAWLWEKLYSSTWKGDRMKEQVGNKSLFCIKHLVTTSEVLKFVFFRVVPTWIYKHVIFQIDHRFFFHILSHFSLLRVKRTDHLRMLITMGQLKLREFVTDQKSCHWLDPLSYL